MGKAHMKWEVRQGSHESAKPIRGIPGSEFEPRCPLQTETGHPIRMSCFFVESELAASTHGQSAYEMGGPAGLLRIGRADSWDTGKRVRASLPAPRRRKVRDAPFPGSPVPGQPESCALLPCVSFPDRTRCAGLRPGCGYAAQQDHVLRHGYKLTGHPIRMSCFFVEGELAVSTHAQSAYKIGYWEGNVTV